jgi:hypothetical protein
MFQKTKGDSMKLGANEAKRLDLPQCYANHKSFCGSPLPNSGFL